MNVFRLAGDMMHLMSILVILLKIRATKSCRGEGGSCAVARECAVAALVAALVGGTRRHPTPLPPAPAGISLKTQELYLLVFVTRYLDLFYSYISL